MRKIIDIYNEYKIMPNLQLHQLRVAASGKQICDSLNLKVDTDSIVRACLLHDMGNIIKFELSYFPALNEPEGIDYWQRVKDEYIAKYGKNEHQATLSILNELKVSEIVLHFVERIDSHHMDSVTTGEDFGQKICMYVDNRVTPHGIVSVEERTLEAKERYKNHPHGFDEEKRILFLNSLFLIEKQIFGQSNISPEDVSDESVAKIIEELRNFEI